MSEFHTATVCAACKAPIDTSQDTPGKRAICPKCGSTKRSHDVSISIRGASARVGMGLKVTRPGQKKPHVEVKSGARHSHKLGKLVDHERLIDRANDRYFEKVTDYESREVIYHAEEPLSKHHGHGSAKKKT
jgi:DNA-directed RNA polymerase subunit RPC12/RpoP